MVNRCKKNIFITVLVHLKSSFMAILYRCYVDFSKAFDMINRHILFYKIMNSGWYVNVMDTMRNLYEKTFFRIKCRGKVCPSVPDTPWRYRQRPSVPEIHGRHERVPRDRVCGSVQMPGYIIRPTTICSGDILKEKSRFLCNRARNAIFGIFQKLRKIGALPPKLMLYIFDTIIKPILLFGSDV